MKAPHKTSEDGPITKTLHSTRLNIAMAFGLGLISNLLLLAIPLYMLQVYDRVLRNESFETLIYLTLIATLAACVIGILDFSRSFIVHKSASAIGRNLRRHIATMAIDRPSRDNRRWRDAVGHIENIQFYLASNGLLAIFDAVWSPIFVLVIWLLHPSLAVFTISLLFVFAALAALQSYLTGKSNCNATHLRRIAKGQEASLLNRSEVVEGLGLAHPLFGLWDTSDRSFADIQQTISTRTNLVASISKSIRMAAQIGVICLGAVLVLANELSAGGIIAASILLARALFPFEQLIGSWGAGVNSFASLKALIELEGHVDHNNPTTAFPPPQGHLSVRGLSFRPLAKKPSVLQGVQFSVRPGTCLGIIGPSGSGKSVLARLLLGTEQPTSGDITLDDVPLTSWNKHNLASFLGYHGQTAELVPGTIKQNITRFADARSEEVINAAKNLGVHAAIAQLPQGYNTQLHSDLRELSAGLKHQISLARAFFGNPSLIILDEPTNNLDGTGEQMLMRAIRSAKERGASVIVMAHRRSALAAADQILVLKEGRIANYGPREAVLKQMTATNQSLSVVTAPSVEQTYLGAKRDEAT